jgi:hypothetical protein
MKFVQVLLALFVVSLFCSEASAWPFRNRSVSASVSRTVSVQRYSSPQAACEAKAAAMAASCRMAHLGGGFGGGSAEGVGCAASASAALGNCCFTGKLPLLGSAVCRGRNGMYYACKVFSSGGSRSVNVQRSRQVIRR